MTASLFPGPAAPSARHIGRSATYVEADSLIEVRHLAGYEAFVSKCSTAGVDPATLAADLESLITFVRAHKDEIEAEGLDDAAAIFFGNVLVHQRADATWLQLNGRSPSVGNDHQRFEASPALWHLVNSDGDTFLKSLDVLNAWIAYRPQ